MPDAASGHVALLALGFTYDSRFAVEAWVGRFRKDFGDNPQVTFYEVPMIGGMARLGKWFIDGGMRKGTSREDHEHVITVYGGTDRWKQRLGFQSPNAAYLILLDQSGTVRWLYRGQFDAEAYAMLSHQVAELLEWRVTLGLPPLGTPAAASIPSGHASGGRQPSRVRGAGCAVPRTDRRMCDRVRVLGREQDANPVEGHRSTRLGLCRCGDRPAQPLSVLPGVSQTGAHPFPQNFPFEFCRAWICKGMVC